MAQCDCHSVSVPPSKAAGLPCLAGNRTQALDVRLARSTKPQVLGAGSSIGADTARFFPGPSNMRRPLGFPKDARVVDLAAGRREAGGSPKPVEAFERILRSVRSLLLLAGCWKAAVDAVDEELRMRIARHPRSVGAGFVADPAPYYRAMVASATELAVVSTLATGARYAVVPEVNRRLVPPENPPAIEEAVLKLLRDTRLGSCMRQAGRKWAVEYFEQSRVLETNVKLY
jgi:glycosyltransferase involved in cell wall biosynthesis